jgi:hypothetical protein
MKPRVLEFGAKAKVTERLTTSGERAQGHQLELQADAYPYDGVWEAVDRATSEQYNDYALAHRPDRNTRYRAVDTSTSPAVVSKTFQAWVYPKLRWRFGRSRVGTVRIAATIAAPDYLALNGKPLHIYRGRKRRGTYTRIGSIKIKRRKGTSYSAVGTRRVPSHRPRTDYFFVCFRIPDTNALTAAKGHADPCGRRRL